MKKTATLIALSVLTATVSFANDTATTAAVKGAATEVKAAATTEVTKEVAPVAVKATEKGKHFASRAKHKKKKMKKAAAEAAESAVEATK
jgi:hypothetical protein